MTRCLSPIFICHPEPIGWGSAKDLVHRVLAQVRVCRHGPLETCGVTDSLCYVRISKAFESAILGGRLRLGKRIGVCRRTRYAPNQQPGKDPPLRVHPSSSSRTALVGPCLFHGPCAFPSHPRRCEGARENHQLQAGEFPPLFRIIFDWVHAHRRISRERSLHPISRLAGILNRWQYKCSRDCLVRSCQSICRHD